MEQGYDKSEHKEKQRKVRASELRRCLGFARLWHKCLKLEISDLTCLLQHNNYLVPITQEVFHLMSNIQSIIRDASFHVRRLLGKRPL